MEAILISVCYGRFNLGHSEVDLSEITTLCQAENVDEMLVEEIKVLARKVSAAAFDWLIDCCIDSAAIGFSAA